MTVSIPLVRQATHRELIGTASTCMLQVNEVLHGPYPKKTFNLVLSGHPTIKTMSWSLLRTVSQFAATVGQGCIRCSFTGSKKFWVHRCKCYKQNQNVAMILIMEINESSAKRDALLQNK